MHCKLCENIKIFLIVSMLIISASRADATDRIIINVFPVTEGKVVFKVHRSLKYLAGIRIFIDGEDKGLTGEDGTLAVGWLLNGDHTWVAYIGGDRISSGEFNVKEIVAIELKNFSIKKNENIMQGVYPLCSDNVSANWTIQNTGTTIIDFFNWKMTTVPTFDDIDIKIVKPKALSVFPVRFFKSWMKKILITEMERQLSINDGQMVWRNTRNNKLVKFYISSPFKAEGEIVNVPNEYKGLKPGEFIEIYEKRPYVEWVSENMHNKALEMGVEISLDVMNWENSLAICKIDGWKFGLIKFKHIEAIIQLKGTVAGIHELSINKELYHTLGLNYEYYSKN